MLKDYDIIVVGAGHAGCEAAAAAANMGSRVLLITMDMTKIADMSCNPAMGGIAKGQIVREIDALGGYSGIVTDESMIQFKMLNKSKGPAMWSPRAQCDRVKFSGIWRKILENIKNIDLWQDTVEELIINEKKVYGVITQMGIKFMSKTVILTNGTFLNGLMHIGNIQIKGGRAGERASKNITEQLNEHGFESGRMKTGTPPRIDGRTINFSIMEEQRGDDTTVPFSYMNDWKKNEKQKSCFITHTNKKVHDIIKTGIKESPLFNGTITSIGPRYCPSIETKIVTFNDKEKHQLFLEPEGNDTIEYYINGFSSSLPWKIQYEALLNIRGLENVKVFRPGYAIEYDYFPPTQLKKSLETKIIENLYFAGQINGTTGYEEAGAQGILAGINAHMKICDSQELILNRDEAYIGVLIDDLVTKGVDEPYRMFTSRAEYRILLRQDDADARLTEKSYKIGLAKEDRLNRYKSKKGKINELISFFKNYSVDPEDINGTLENVKSSKIKQKVKIYDILLRPEIKITLLSDSIKPLYDLIEQINERKEEIIESAEIVMKYSGYINREKNIAEKFKRLENIGIENKFNYKEILSLSTEARQKLTKINPKTIGQASRISGVNPSDINVLLILLGR
ncbi:tRNA uridine-5-carboxymethylaminomethyl(34) synthesis enzyme MnmG [Bacteroidota bacterium]